MAQIRLRDRNQLTLPAAIAAAAKLRPDDSLDVSFVNGVITLIPVQRAANRSSIIDFVGSGKGIWGNSAQEIDAYVRQERDSWER
jgi:hypothetical protein